MISVRFAVMAALRAPSFRWDRAASIAYLEAVTVLPAIPAAPVAAPTDNRPAP